MQTIKITIRDGKADSVEISESKAEVSNLLPPDKVEELLIGLERQVLHGEA
ncbi:MAG: hypothetical protein GX663_01145 [Clostridiales bacterium]|nr:hypothetical protein [Clostridiales bacterium]